MCIRDSIEGVLKRQCRCICLDPYANAFNEKADNKGHQQDDTKMGPMIWERKYEIDSLCYPIQLAYLYWKNSGRTSHFDQDFKRAMETVLDLSLIHILMPMRFQSGNAAGDLLTALMPPVLRRPAYFRFL